MFFKLFTLLVISILQINSSEPLNIKTTLKKHNLKSKSKSSFTNFSKSLPKKEFIHTIKEKSNSFEFYKCYSNDRKSPTSIEIKKREITYTDIGDISSGVYDMNNLKKIIYHVNGGTKSEAKELILIKQILENKKIEEISLNFGNKSIKDDLFKNLCELVIYNENIKNFNISGIEISNNKIYFLCNKFHDRKSKIKIYLSKKLLTKGFEEYIYEKDSSLLSFSIK